MTDEGNVREKEKGQNDHVQQELKVQSLPSSPKKSEFDDHTKSESHKKGHRPRSKSIAEIQSPVLDAPIISDFPTSETTNRSIPSRAKKQRYPTQCACLKNGQHYDNVSLNTTFTGTVEKIYNLIFINKFFENYISQHEKCTGTFTLFASCGSIKFNKNEEKKKTNCISFISFNLDSFTFQMLTSVNGIRLMGIWYGIQVMSNR